MIMLTPSSWEMQMEVVSHCFISSRYKQYRILYLLVDLVDTFVFLSFVNLTEVFIVGIYSF